MYPWYRKASFLNGDWDVSYEVRPKGQVESTLTMKSMMARDVANIFASCGLTQQPPGLQYFQQKAKLV